MPARIRHKNYNRVDDTADSRIPLHNEEAFQHGFNFKAKYIGTLVVPRPTGRMEIVVAMRKIRFDFKAKQIKKRKVNVSVSVEGVKTILRKKKKKGWVWDESSMLIMQDPIYRIFYVSHDSHDLKIWSYIARDSNSNKFRCNVFKSKKKSQAMLIVRTIGQAFEVCHKFQNTPAIQATDSRGTEVKTKQENSGRKDQTRKVKEASRMGNGEVEETDIDAADVEESSQLVASEVHRGVTDLDTIHKHESGHAGQKPPSSPEPSNQPSEKGSHPPEGIASSIRHQLKLMQQKVAHAEQQTDMARVQVQLLKDQLAAESAARVQFETRNHQLMAQNRELITHMSQMVSQMKDNETASRMKHSSASTRIGNTGKYQRDLSNVNTMVIDGEIPAPSPLFLSSYSAINSLENTLIEGHSLFENVNTSIPLYGHAAPKLSTNSSRQQDFSSLDSGSVVANNHTTSLGQGSRANGTIGQCETSESSSSSSSEDEEESTQHSSSTMTFQQTPIKMPLEPSIPPSRGLIRQEEDLLTFYDTENTSIWTSGLATPSSPVTSQSSADDTTLTSSPSLLSTTRPYQLASDTSIMNGYTLSPISLKDEASLSVDVPSSKGRVEKTSANPIRWHRPSSSLVSSASGQQDIRRLHPPPPSAKGRDLTKSPPPSAHQTSSVSDPGASLYSVTDFSFPTTDSPNLSKPELTGMSQFDPMRSANFFELTGGSYQQQTQSDQARIPPAKQKLFDLDPAGYERRLRYEPLHKVQASQWTNSFAKDHKNPQSDRGTSLRKLTPSKPKRSNTAPLMVPNEANISVGSILDSADVPAHTSANDFCDEDTTDAGKTQGFQVSGCNKILFREDEEDDPLSVLEELSSVTLRRSSSTGDVGNSFHDNTVDSLEVKSSQQTSLQPKAPPKTLPLTVDHLASSASLNDDTPVLKPLLSPVTSKKRSETIIPGSEVTLQKEDLPSLPCSDPSFHPRASSDVGQEEKSSF